MRTWKVRLREKGSDHVIETSLTKDDADRQYVIDWFGLNEPDVEWYEIEEPNQ